MSFYSSQSLESTRRMLRLAEEVRAFIPTGLILRAYGCISNFQMFTSVFQSQDTGNKTMVMLDQQGGNFNRFRFVKVEEPQLVCTMLTGVTLTRLTCVC